MDKPPLAPRLAVQAMAPYHPPTGHRQGKLRLDFNENTVGCSARVLETLRTSLDSETLAVYPDYERVERNLAAFFQVSPDEIVLTNGTDEAIHVLIDTYVDTGAEVLMLRPSYAMYRFYSELAGARVVEVAYVPPKLEFPFRALLDAITPHTRAILISNPNNPTGVATGLAEIEQILQKAPHAAVLIDEAYYEFYGVTALKLIRDYPNLFVSRTFSKVYGMAAMRIGCLFSQSGGAQLLRKARSPYSVNTLAALAAEAAVDDPEYVAAYVAEALAARRSLELGLDALGIAHVPSSANFLLGYFGDRAVEVRDTLSRHAILVRDRSYEIPGGVRITTGTCEQTRRVLEELEAIW